MPFDDLIAILRAWLRSKTVVSRQYNFHYFFSMSWADAQFLDAQPRDQLYNARQWIFYDQGDSFGLLDRYFIFENWKCWFR